MRLLIDLLRDGEADLISGRHQEAATMFDAILAKSPNSVEAANGLAIAHHHLGNTGSAIAAFSHAVQIGRDKPDVWANMGATLRYAGHIDWGRAAYQEALRLTPGHAGALNGMAGSFVNEGDPEKGVTWGRKAVAVSADFPAGHLNLALCLMELGRWSEAWPHWKRRVIPGCVNRHYPGERWRGEDVDWLIVHGEQGLGDEVMFLGCLPQLLDRAHSGVIIEVNPRLVPLVKRSFPACTVIGDQKDFVHPGEGVIAVAAIGDLPEFCAGGEPPKVSGYLKSETANVGFKDTVLLAMRGGTPGTHDYLRNPPVAEWAPVVDAIRAAGLRPVSIQYGADGAALAAAIGVEHDAEAAGDLANQAAAIAGCRALVSVQQTALHLGGAIGAHVLGVVSNKPAWRYGITGLMPWYETVELYRQLPAEKGWQPVMRRVARAVKALGVKVAA